MFAQFQFAELLTNAMGFVLPSDFEGLSLALLVAMGAGLCVLTTDVLENRKPIEDAGFTFRRGDVADLAERLQFLIANPAVRKAAGEAAKRRILDRDQWNMIAVEIERVYFETMGGDLTETGVKKPSERWKPSRRGQNERPDQGVKLRQAKSGSLTRVNARASRRDYSRPFLFTMTGCHASQRNSTYGEYDSRHRRSRFYRIQLHFAVDGAGNDAGHQPGQTHVRWKHSQFGNHCE